MNEGIARKIRACLLSVSDKAAFLCHISKGVSAWDENTYKYLAPTSILFHFTDNSLIIQKIQN